jgi:hypothetical protein
VLSPEGGALESVSPRGCSQTLEKCTSTGTSPCVNNSLFISSLLSHFVEKKYFHGNMQTYKIWGGLPQHNTLGFFCWGRSLKIHTEIKRELFTHLAITQLQELNKKKTQFSSYIIMMHFLNL